MFRLACGLYDNLEVFSMRKTKVELTYLNEDGEEIVVEGLITDLVAKDGIESIIFNSDKVIKTQDIIIVNGLDYKS
ncbi:MAG: hypothetical protein KAH10_03965 [Flavobacteriales bacterium]|nr:hypothetical protein [Flavobacteriales bacterium]